jgi:hypothetical protein
MRAGTEPDNWKVVPLAPEGTPVFVSPDPEAVHLGQPSLEALPSGRLVAAFDQYGPGVRALPGAKGKLARLNRWLQGRIYISNDKGQTWTFRHDFPFSDARLFRDGSFLYAIGHADTVQIIRSSDGGETWSKPADLSAPEEHYTQAPGNVLTANGCLYVPLMKVTDPAARGESGSTLAPVLMRAAAGANLTARKSWAFSQAAPLLRELAPDGSLDHFGVPFFAVPNPERGAEVARRRWANPIGWGDPHVLQIRDRNHYWQDASGRVLHIVARAATHRANFAALLRVTEDEAGGIAAGLQTTPAGNKLTFLPMPGGHLKFSVAYDDASRLFWLVSHQATDSMTRAERLPEERYRLPCDECHRLQLHYSRNLVDWCFAGYLTGSARAGECRHSPCLTFRGNDMGVVLCVGDGKGRNPHDASRITYHAIPNFRELVY